MNIKDTIREPFIKTMDNIFKFIPRKKPTEEKLRDVKIIAHRGWHDAETKENTLEALEKCLGTGLWGIEFDIRWTKDLVPVVHHDVTTGRVFGADFKISELYFYELRERVPEIPSLQEVLQKLAGNIHLIIEIKWEDYPELEYQKQVLAEHLQNLEPIKDYHLLGIGPKSLEAFDNFSNDCKLLVGDTSIFEMSEIALMNNYSGVAGHFAFIGSGMIKAHHQKNQSIGTAYICSKNSLYREINRGVDWIFTNHPWRILPFLPK